VFGDADRDRVRPAERGVEALVVRRALRDADLRAEVSVGALDAKLVETVGVTRARAPKAARSEAGEGLSPVGVVRRIIGVDIDTRHVKDDGRVDRHVADIRIRRADPVGTVAAGQYEGDESETHDSAQ
jgi:hypothetical protein